MPARRIVITTERLALTTWLSTDIEDLAAPTVACPRADGGKGAGVAAENTPAFDAAMRRLLYLLKERGLLDIWSWYSPEEQRQFFLYVAEALPEWFEGRLYEVANDVANGFPPRSKWRRRLRNFSQTYFSRHPLGPGFGA